MSSQFIDSEPETEHSEIDRLIAQYRPGYEFSRGFYQSEKLFQKEIEQVYSRSWIFAGHACEIPEPGDYFVFNVADESIIIIRDKEYQIRAYANVCRHRGSRLCQQSCGNTKNIVCPYHQWSYRLDGSLRSASFMGDSFEKQDHSLHAFSVRDLAGLVYICLAEDPPDFDAAYEAINPQLQSNDFAHAKICCQFQYEIKANWKIVIENNRECYHCRVSHPEFCKSNFDVGMNGDRRADEKFQQMHEEQKKDWERLGLHPEDISFPNGAWYRISRFPLKDGFLTESLDGKRVAPLMGTITEPRTGSLRVVTLPNAWIHGNCDYGVTTRLSPVSPNLTQAQVTFLVHPDAKPDVDYHAENVAAVWKATSEQDWNLCEETHLGVKSQFYKPGMLSPLVENSLNDFINWYIRQIQ